MGRTINATPGDARRMWESMARPSHRRVADALTQAGKTVSPSTIRTWHQQGWAFKRAPANAPPGELDAATPVLTGDASRRIASLHAELDPVDEDLTNEERVARALRELADSSLTVLRVVRLADPEQVLAHPDKIGALLERAANALVAAVEGLTSLHKIHASAVTDVAPHRPADADALPPLVGTLEAITRAWEEQT
jgi:hypothetical protein